MQTLIREVTKGTIPEEEEDLQHVLSLKYDQPKIKRWWVLELIPSI